ncbi:DUF2659 domain-containing protein [Rickettsia sp. MEAM1 (Bemisia tabaci)]|uniref:DUF2659 family protein n=1 Tax=unclassified Rickettsia TaxID=114295 RepID=UPI0002E3FC91|nr:MULTISPECIES: DUF2659 family protein [unclassified Rickettsia]ASX28067.1 DUF2659 domain-containing protein [Rickettsia sp. MEAM1 (Bemisia tabaci)]ODA37295.1 DUF2659 domain-containing protein [Rickettsia sp. wb]ODA38268.1 DUF2659 domain-containing protein [Rickettsia sp. wq]
MTDILDEVLNDQNEEKRLIFFKRLLPIVIIIALISITIMVINNNNKSKQIENNQKNGDIFVKAVNLEVVQGNRELAISTLENLVSISDTKIKEIALLEQVAIKLSGKQNSEAKDLLNKIIENKEYSEIVTSYARIAWCSLVIDDEKLDIAYKEKLVKYLNYFDDENKPFWATANIMKAIWDIKSNMLAEAEKNLRSLVASNNTSDLLKDQAKALLAGLDRAK